MPYYDDGTPRPAKRRPRPGYYEATVCYGCKAIIPHSHLTKMNLDDPTNVNCPFCGCIDIGEEEIEIPDPRI